MHHELPEISVQQTAELIQSEHPPLLIDCREKHEHDFCRIKGAILVPLSEFAGKAEALFDNNDDFAIIYCHHGVRSLHAVQYLAQQGFTNTLSMQGGIDLWSAKIDPDISRY